MDLQQIRQRLNSIDWLRTAALIFGILAACSILWNHFYPKQQAATTYSTAAPIPAAANVPTQELPPQRVIVLVKQEAIKKLPDLPPEVKNDPKAQITTTADIKPSPYGGSAVAFINTSTGRSSIVYKAKERPFFEFKRQVELYAEYGVSTRGNQQAAAGSRWTFIRTGAINWHAKGEINSAPEAKAMLGVHGYLWE